MGKRKKKESRTGIELIIIIVFFLSFIAWAVSQCNATKQKFQELASNETDTSSVVKKAIVDEIIATKLQDSLNKQQELAKPGLKAQTNTPVVTKTIIQKYTPLYISIDSLKLRSGPGLNYEVIMKLPLHQEVTFLNEVSDSTQILNIGGLIVNEPWVKVQHPKGHIGWVYGGYVDYYKKIMAQEE